MASIIFYQFKKIFDFMDSIKNILLRNKGSHSYKRLFLIIRVKGYMP